MPEPAPIADATVFLGMHDQDELIRQRSLGFFRSYFTRQVWMNFEQVGICDAVIWRQRREVQDLYYPFMDRLHSDMQIVRGGYSTRELDLAVSHPDLQALRPEQALLAAQVLERRAGLITHDPVLRRLPCVKSQLWDFESSDPHAAFPPELEALYETSRVFVHVALE